MTKTEFARLFQGIPSELAVELEKQYSLIKKNFIECRFEPTELDAGKLCEVVFRILEWYTAPDKKYTLLGQTIKPDFFVACRQFESMSNFQDSVRFHIPKLMVFLYSIRNKRGVGHLGGDVNPNQMDSTAIVHCCDWMLGN